MIPLVLDTRTNTAPATPAAGGYMRQIDGLRALAVSLVIFHHFVSSRMEPGTFGVILFFVISGFLITGILLESKSRIEAELLTTGRAIKLFYIRRFLRIFPLYFLVLAILWLLNVGAVRQQIVWLATYTINLWIALHHTFPIATGHFWSLAVEEQFYVFWPFVVLLLPRRYLKPTILVLLFSAVAFRAIGKVVFGLHPTINALTLAQLDSLSLGALLALRNQVDTRVIRKIGIFCAPLLAMELVCAYLGRAVELRLLTLELLCGLCGASLVSYAAQGIHGIGGQLLSLAPVTYIGKISYGIYVYHFPIYALVPNRVVALLLTFLVASISWHLFENPINALKSRFSAAKFQMPAASAQLTSRPARQATEGGTDDACLGH